MLSPNRYYFAPVRIALCLACVTYQPVEGARRLTVNVVDLVESPNDPKVCQVATKDASGQSMYHIGFSLDMQDSGGCKIGSCSFYNMPQLAANFIEKPVRTPPTGQIGNCRCLMKLPPDEKAQLKEDQTQLGSDGGKTMLNFISHRNDPCTEYGCWLKYNHFAHLATRTSTQFKDDWTSGNHWEFACATGKATLQDLKTVKEVRDELPEDKQEEFSKLIEDEGILQALVEEDEPQLFHEEEVHFDTDSTEKRRVAVPEATGGTAAVPEATANKLQKAVDLLMHVEVKLATMLGEAQGCKSNRLLGSEPAAQEIESETACEALWLNMEVLVNLSKRNVDLGEAFLAASALSNADAALLEAFLLEIYASMALQSSIVHSLENLLTGGREAVEVVEDHILMQLGEAADDAAWSRGLLQHAFDAIMA